MLNFFRKGKTHNKLFAQNEFWLRLVTLLVYAGTAALRNILHNVGGKSSDPVKLYNELLPYKGHFTGLLKKKVIRLDQYKLIYPVNGETYSDRFDITLLVLLIQQCTNVSPPIGAKGWKTDVDKIKKHDTSLGAYILKLRKLRNYIVHHYITTDLPYAEFLHHWRELIYLLKCLGYTISKSVERLKTDSLDDLDQFKLSLVQAKVIHFEESIFTLTKDIKTNEQMGFNLHLQQGVLAADMKTIEDTVQDITSKMLQVDSAQNNCTHEIELIKVNIKSITAMTEDVQKTIEKSQHGYGISFQQVIDILKKLEHQVLSDLTERVDKLEDKIDQVEIPNFQDRLDKASNYLKTAISSKYDRGCLQNPFLIQNSVKKFFVDLVILDIAESSNDFQKTDREHHINVQLKRSKSISIKNLIELDNHGYMILRGCAGVGKSFLTNHFHDLWSKCQIWTNFKFVFHFSCRELNSLSHIGTLEKLLDEFYPEIFKYIKFKELLGISNHICIIIDGLDEFLGVGELEGLYTGECSATFPITKCLFNILSLKYNMLSNSLVLISGRPAACSILLNGLTNVNKKVVDVLGFDANNVDQYVETFFSRDSERASLLKQEISANPAINLMVRIPVYLNILCFLYESQEQFEIPKTITDLYVLELILFMKKHFPKHAQVSLNGLIQDGEFCKTVIDLAEISYHTLEKGKIVVDDQDKIACLPSFEILKTTGMITEIDTIRGKKYQYFHLTMQEFLAAIHIILSGMDLNDLYHEPCKRGPTVAYTNEKRLRGTLPLVFGLQGAEMNAEQGVYFPRDLMLNIRKWCNDSRCVPLRINILFKRVQSKSAFDVTLETKSEYALFLHCYYEYQNRLEHDEWLKNVSNTFGGIDLVFHIKIPLHVKHLSFFLANELKHIKSLEVSISNCLDAINKNDLSMLFTYILKTKQFKCDDLTLKHFPLNFLDRESSHSKTVPESLANESNVVNEQRFPSGQSIDCRNSVVSATTDKVFINIKVLQIVLTESKGSFDKAWLTLPESLILDSWLSMDVVIELLHDWMENLNCKNLKSVTLSLLDSTNVNLGHVLAIVDIFHFVAKIFINIPTSELDGFTTCDDFVSHLTVFLKPRNSPLNMLTLKLRTDKHVYQVAECFPTCKQCINGINIRNTPVYEDDEIFGFEKVSAHGSINSTTESINMADFRDTAALVHQEGRPFCTLKKSFLVLLAVIVIGGVIGAVLVWLFEFRS